MSLLEVEDLSVSFKVEGGTLEAVRRVSFAIDKGETLALVGESGSGKSVTALSILQLLPYPKAWHPSGSIRLDGQELIGADERDAARGARRPRRHHLPGADDLAQPAAHDRAADRRDPDAAPGHEQAGRAGAGARAAASGAPAGGGAAPRRLSASALRRPAPAGDDRDGARQRARPADRRRADHRARRHHPGADPDAAARPAAAARHGDAADHPRSHHRAQGRRPRLRDDRGPDRRGRAGRGGVRAAAASLHPAPARRRAQGQAAQPRRRRAGGDGRPTSVKVHFPIQRGLLRRTVGHVKAVDGVDLRVRRGQTVGVVGESGSGKTTLGLALLRLLRSEGAIRFRDQDIQGWSSRRLRPLRRDMQIVFQDPFGSLSPRMSVGADHRGGAQAARHRRRPRTAGGAWSPRCSRRSASIPRARTATRTSSPAASGSASASPARWCSSRASSCSTSRPPRSTCRCRRRSSTCCATCRRGTASPTCSSATTCASCAR